MQGAAPAGSTVHTEATRPQAVIDAAVTKARSLLHPCRMEPFAGLLEENTPGDIPTDVPILLVHGEADEQLPAETSRQYLERACRAGTTTVELRTYPAANHHSVLVDARPDITTFITDRLTGTEHSPTPCP